MANPGATATNIGAGAALGALGPVGMGLSAANTVSGLLGGPTLGSTLFGTNPTPAAYNDLIDLNTPVADQPNTSPTPASPAPSAAPAAATSSHQGMSDPVSYTHLTLPTKRIV